MKKSIALKYPGNADAPFIVASAKGSLADRMISIARESGVPVVKNDVLADVLSIGSVGDYIPKETYAVVAQVFAFILKVEKESINENIQKDKLR